MIQSQWLKPSIFRTNFHGPKDVLAIEVWLYVKKMKFWEIRKVAFKGGGCFWEVDGFYFNKNVSMAWNK